MRKITFTTLLTCLLSCFAFSLLPTAAQAQCVNGTLAVAGTANLASGTTSAAASSTAACQSTGTYYNWTVCAGDTYRWATCGASFDTQLTVTSSDGLTVKAYNDDFCALQSQVDWVADVDGQVRVYVHRIGCQGDDGVPTTPDCANVLGSRIVTSLPSITCPANVVATASEVAGGCGARPTYAPPTTTGACETAAMVSGGNSGDFFPIGVTTVTWRVTDTRGATANCSFTVTVNDQDPQITCPANITQGTDPGVCTAVVNYTTPVGTDNCSSTTTLQAGLASGTSFPLGTTTISYQVREDDGDNTTASCGFTVTVEDNEAPSAICQDLTVNLQPDGTISIPGTSIDNGSSDNCTNPVNYPVGGAFFDCSNVGAPNPLTMTISDDAGNTASCSANITVNDVTPPTASCVAIHTAELDAAGNASITTADIDNGSTDACGVQTLALDITDFTCADVGNNGVTLTVTDVNGNTSSCNAVVDVQDNINPIFNDCPANITVPNDPGQCGANVTWTPPSNITDNCPGSITITPPTQNPGDFFAVGASTIIQYTAKDANNNFSTCTFNITVNDTEPPVPACNDLTVDLDANGDGSITITDVHNAGASTDNCGTVNPLFITQSNFGCDDVGTVTVTLTAADGNSNFGTCNATITVRDLIPPAIDTPAANATVECDGAGNTTDINFWLLNHGNAVASDACNPLTWSNDYSALSDDCGATGSATVTFTVADDYGNTATTSATFTIEDTTPPAFDTAPAPMTVECDGAGNTAALNAWLTAPAAADDCGTVTITNDFTALSDDCGATGSATVTFTAEDECGNTSTASATFTIEDTTPPSIDTPAANASAECDGTADPGGAFAAWLASNGGAAASDDCGTVTFSNNSTGLAAGTCIGEMTETVTFTATDDCGLTATTSATFTITDTTPPTFITPPAPMTVECDGAGNTADLNNWLLNAPTGVSDVCSNVTVTNDFTALSDDCGATGSATVTFTASDDCGNTATASATFTIEDTTPPAFDTAPAPMTVECDGTGNTADLNAWLAAPAASDDCGMVTITNDFTALSDDCGATGSATVTFTAEDECGNTTTASATFIIEDTTPPAFDVSPFNATVECDGTSDPSGALTGWLAAPTASDDCGTVTITNDFTALSPDCGATGSATVTFTAEDECGNTTTASATFTIEDTTPPSIDTPASNSSVACDGTADPNGAYAAWLAANGGATASDDCGSVSFSNNSSGLVPGSCPGSFAETVTFTATDECGLASTTSATFSIGDNAPPSFDVAPADLTVECDGAGNAADLAAWLAAPTASDDCSNVTVSNNFAGLTDDCGATGTSMSAPCTDVIITITGDAFASFDNSFDLVDDDDGTVYASGAIGDIPNNATYTETVCVTVGKNVTFTIYDDFGDGMCCSFGPGFYTVENDGNIVASGGSFLTSESTSFTISGPAPTPGPVTFTATDECGNVTTATATFTIEDTTPPTFDTAPAPMTVECDGSGNTADLNAWLTSNAGATASDACGTVIISNNFTALSNDCGATGSALVTFTATDDCGNTSTATAEFIIEDTTPPAFSPAPANQTVECDGAGNVADLLAWLNAPAATDDCGTATVTNDYFALTGGCAETGTTTVTFTATDECGLTTTASATFTIEDTTPPTFDAMPVSRTVECDGNGNIIALTTWLSNDAGASISDVCGNASLTNDFTALSDDCGETGSALVTFTATDDCGNTATATAEFIIEDTTPPVFDTAPAPMTVECDGAGNTADLAAWLAAPAASDDCGTVTITNNFAALSDDCGETGSATVTFTATDDCGLTTTASATFIIEDTTPPAFDTPPASMTVECDGAGNTADLTAWLAAPTASDDCGTVTITNNFAALSDDCGETGSATVTFTATDDCGLTATASATFIIEDTTPPTASCPANITQAADPGTCSAVVSYTVTGADDCGTASVSSLPVSGSTFAVGTTTVNATVADECGNTSACSFDVTITDSEPPSAICQDVTVSLDASGTATITAPEIDNGSSDNCGPVTTSVAPTFFSCATIGVVPVTLTVTDGGGNTASCSANVTVVDDEGPSIVCPGDIVHPADASGTQADVTVAMPTANDNCGIASIVNDYNGTGNASDTYPSGTTVVTWTATDINGNTTSCAHAVTVAPEGFPYIACPSDITRSVDAGACNAFVPVPVPQRSDDTGLPTLLNDYNFTSNASDLYNVGATVVTWTVTDDDGNESQCSMNITVVDDVAPSIICPNPITQTADAGVCEAAVSIVSAVANDNCPGVMVLNDYNGTADASDTYPVGTTTVTFVATDAYDNTASCTVTVTVTDDENPVISCPASIAQSADQGQCLASIIVGDATATDNCNVASLTNDFNGTGNASGDYPVGSTTVTFTATDDSGNTASCSFTVDVTDDEAPVADCTGSIVQVVANLGDTDAFVAVPAPIASDNCGTAAVVTNDRTGLATDADDTYPVGTTTVTWTVQDDAGNTASCTVDVTVLADPTQPSIACPYSVTQETDPGVCSAAVTTGAPTVSDDTGINSVLNDYNGTGDASGSYPTGSTTVTWTVEDLDGNTQSCVHTITVNDYEKPAISCVADITQSVDAGSCDATVGVPIPLTSDNCAVATLVNDFNGSGDASDVYPLGTTNVNWTVTDVNGNINLCATAITVVDDVPPMAVCQAQTVVLDANGSAFITEADVDGGSSDGCGIASFDVSPSLFGCADAGDNVVTLTVTDIHGNSSSCTSVVTIESPAPTAICQDATVELNASGVASISAADIDNGSSAVCAIESMSIAPDVFTCADAGTVTVTLTVEDTAGSTASCTANVTVEDNIDPVIHDCPASFVTCSKTPTWTPPTATDNCPNVVLTSNFDPGDTFPVGVTTVIYTATDASGNTTECSFDVEVIELNVTATVTSDYNGSDISCFGEDDGEATATVVGGDAPYDYLWSNGTTIDINKNLTSGTYTVTVTDVNGCTGTAEVTLVDPPQVTLTAAITSNYNGADISCTDAADGEATATGAGGTGTLSYAWSDGQTTAVATGLSGGTYQVTVTDLNGCSATDEVILTEPLPVTVNIIAQTADVSCDDGSDGEATVTASGGTGTLIYTWSNGQTTATATGLSPGVYTVTVTDANDCSDTGSVTIDPPAPPDATAAVTSNYNGFGVSCNGAADGEAEVTVNDGGTYTFAWSNGAGTQAVTGLSAGSYTVTVSGAAGCSAVLNVFVTQPTALSCFAKGENPSCNGETDGEVSALVFGGVPGYTFDWDGPGGPYTGQVVTGVGAGTYNLTVTDSNGCVCTSTVDLTEPDPIDPLTSLGVVFQGGQPGSPYYYNTAQVTFTGGTPPYSYNWITSGYVRYAYVLNADGSTTINIIYAEGADWTVEVSDYNGCGGSALTFSNDDPTADLLDIVSYNITGDSGNCSGAIDIEVQGGDTSCGTYTYDWTATIDPAFSETTQDITGLCSGWYIVIVTDCLGETALATYWVPQQTGGTGGSTTSGGFTRNKLAINEGMGIGVAPNPFTHETVVRFSLLNADEVTLEMFTINGMRVATLFEGKADAELEYDIPFDGTDLPAGMYVVKLTNAKGASVHQKVTIVK